VLATGVPDRVVVAPEVVEPSPAERLMLVHSGVAGSQDLIEGLGK
jgi:hypothetical protein